MHEVLNLTNTWVWILSFLTFIVGYYYIAREEHYNINKAKPALFMWTFMFLLIWIYFVINWLDIWLLHNETQKIILEISEIFFFLLVAMTFIEVLIDRWVFDVLRKKLLSNWYTYKQLFWILWFLSFFLSPFADNLTTVLILSTVLISISNKKSFLVPSIINIVVASNAWWVWSPFWDVTTLMAWTADKWTFFDFIKLFPSAFIWWLVTALIISFYVKNKKPKVNKKLLKAKLKPWAKSIIILWFFTIFMAVMNQQLFNIPPVWWMMYWLALLQLITYKTKKHDAKNLSIYKDMKRIGLDTLLFFFWILSAVWALDFLWFLDYIANFYTHIWVVWWNITIWFLSAFIDNIPVMSAVLKSSVEMWEYWWLFLTLTIWIWGSLISFWSAAWIWAMWKMKWLYTFWEHFKFFPIILFWYIISIVVFYLQFYIL